MNKITVYAKQKFNFKWYSKCVPYIYIWLETFKQQKFPILILVMIALLSKCLPYENVFWMILGIVLSCITTELIIEPNKCYNLEQQNKHNTENIFCTIHSIFYILVHLTNSITGLEDNHYNMRDYYINKQGYYNKISDILEHIKLIEEKGSSDDALKIKQNNKKDIEALKLLLEHIITLLNGLPSNLQITKIKYTIYQMQEFLIGSFVEIRYGSSISDLTHLFKQYVEILNILNNNFFIHQGFMPSRHWYYTISLKADK